MRKFPGLVNVEIERDQQGRSKGHAKATYDTHEHAVQAMQKLDGYLILSR